MPVGRVHDEPGRLVHHEDVFVLVEDVDGDVLAKQREGRLRVRHVDDQPLATADLV